MKNYMALKEQTTKGKYRSVILIDLQNKKTICVTGNIPELFHGMIIALQTEYDAEEKIIYATDYKLCIDEKNRKQLRKAGINVPDYIQALDRHQKFKKEEISWDVAKTDITSIYESTDFTEADLIHFKLVNEPFDLIRLNAIAKEIISLTRSKRKISYSIEEYLSYFSDIEALGSYEPLDVAHKMICIKLAAYEFKDTRIWDKTLEIKEDFVFDNVKKRINEKRPLLSDEEIETYKAEISDRGLAEEQLKVLNCLKDTAPCVVTGGAGVGKTTVIKTVLECYTKRHEEKGVLLTAPTGKASRRLAEKTGFCTATIHKALKKKPDDDHAYFNASNPLMYRVIIVDESSMVDTELMFDLLYAAGEWCKLIFVGDPNQLCPVGYGEPFFNFINMLPAFKLEVNHRQSEDTDILNNANGVLENKPLYTGRGITVTNINLSDVEKYLLDEENLQILTPYNAVNAKINDLMKKGNEALNKGDKIIMTRNTEEYCNGDIGIIEKITKKSVTVNIEGQKKKIIGDDRDDISLAYAITVHKMQGSEAEKIIVFLPQSALADKHMVYTALTRARKEATVYFYTADVKYDEQ